MSHPQGEDVLDRVAKEMGLTMNLELLHQDTSARARARSQQDSEGHVEKLGCDALEPKPASVPLPGSEVQAMTPA